MSMKKGATLGPRALGHRSLLASASARNAKARLNLIKQRAWYRPVAPMMTYEFSTRLFGAGTISPCMSFAPQASSMWAARLPEAIHLDSSTRLQPVTPEQDGWLYSLLKAVGEAFGHDEVLLNTSFNQRNKPIINRIVAALEVMDSTPELGHVLIEDVLFTRAVQ